MKKLITTLLFLFPLVLFSQLGNTLQQIQTNFGTKYQTHFINGVKTISYDYQLDSGLERWSFIFETFGGQEYCTAWVLFRPIALLNKSYKELKDYVQIDDSTWIDYVSNSVIKLDINREDGYYSLQIKFLK